MSQNPTLSLMVRRAQHSTTVCDASSHSATSGTGYDLSGLTFAAMILRNWTCHAHVGVIIQDLCSELKQQCDEWLTNLDASTMHSIE